MRHSVYSFVHFPDFPIISGGDTLNNGCCCCSQRQREGSDGSYSMVTMKVALASNLSL